MNYRHQFHAGNFADVMKHVLLVQLVRALQKKAKGFLYLDTHAGRGGYDLAAAEKGDSLARKPEWPDGIGRLWGNPALPGDFDSYLNAVHDANRARGVKEDVLRFYPGSPEIASCILRKHDRLALCEKQEDEFLALAAAFRAVPRTSLHEMDGYTALRAMLPPPERRALVLIDPPFEAQDEFAQIAAALGEGLKRFSTGVFAVWYPLTERARVDDFFDAVLALRPPPTLFVELTIAGEASAIKLKGCGLLVINPPWQFDRAAESALAWLAPALAQAAGGGARVTWLVRESG
jgi:23S rRNA (adenine2030-N6)-methyltransferase